MTTYEQRKEEQAKQIANQLYNKFYNTSSHPHHVETRQQIAKEYSLIAVEFARDQFDKFCCAEGGTYGDPNDHFDDIKQEIEKL